MNINKMVLIEKTKSLKHYINPNNTVYHSQNIYIIKFNQFSPYEDDTK